MLNRNVTVVGLDCRPCPGARRTGTPVKDRTVLNSERNSQRPDAYTIDGCAAAVMLEPMTLLELYEIHTIAPETLSPVGGQRCITWVSCTSASTPSAADCREWKRRPRNELVGSGFAAEYTAEGETTQQMLSGERQRPGCRTPAGILRSREKVLHLPGT